MKIIDRYIFTSFLQKFVVILVILTVIMVLQSIWLYISEFAGKDLELSVIAKFIFYSIPISIPITLPLTILFSSIMVFGEFSEHYEFAAMKSTGISLQRAMRTLSVFIVVLGFATFYFSDSVIPASYQKFINLRRNVVKRKPARAIVANRFNELQGFNIKVDSKSGDNDQYLSNVIIHKESPNKAGNFTVIKSEKGELISAINSNVLSLKLTNGHYYEDLQPKKYQDKQKVPFIKSSFEEYTMNLNLGDINDVTVSESDYAKNRKMRGVAVLVKDVDSFSTNLNESRKRQFKRNLSSTGFNKTFKPAKSDCITEEYPNEIVDLFDLKTRKNIYSNASRSVADIIRTLETSDTTQRKRAENLNKFEIAIHEKFALAVACIVLFFIGAPIGAIIRKGGLGLPALYAFGLFLVYYFIGIFAKNTAEDGSISPFIASWLSTFIFMPLGILFTHRATNDKGLLSLGELFHKISKRFKKTD